MRNNPDQQELWPTTVFPERIATPTIDADKFRLRLKTAMSGALRDCKIDRHEVAAEMARILNVPTFSKGMLDNYTSPSKADHDITVIRFKAFVRATDANHLWDAVVADDGLLMLEGDEARLAEIARLQQEQRELGQRLRVLRSKPVQIKREA